MSPAIDFLDFCATTILDFLDFTQRTDTLSAKLRVNLNVLGERMGISRASLFAYRTGKSPISRKALWRLQLAERQAGIALPEGENMTIPITSMIAEDAAAALTNPFDPPPSDARKRKQMADQLRAIADKLDPPQP